MVDWRSNFWPRLWAEFKNLIPLFRYLILQTETHAFCLALACAALIGFFPSCLVMLSTLKHVLHWDLAYDVTLEMARGYFLPSDTGFITRNLEARLAAFRNGIGWGSVLWVLVGAAGVFVPLESALNRLWEVKEDRPYWKNQIIGFALTSICAALGLFFVLFSSVLHWVIQYFPQIVQGVFRFSVIQVAGTGFFILSIFSLYKLLPNKKIETFQVLPASVAAGILVEVVRLVYFKLAPNLESTQGPFAISVTFLILAYIETFVVLGCAYLASKKDRYPWIKFIPMKEESARDLPP
jgi:membrane protein